MRTLVVSDLHLGASSDRDVLRRPVALDALREQVAEVDRLVLLGDTLELAEGRPRYAMQAARLPLHALADALGRGKEVVIVAGNHDHGLVRPFLRGLRGGERRLGLATRVPVGSSPQLRAMAEALKPARVRVQYPGVWLGRDVYATHGHYADRHLVPRARGVLAKGPLAPVPEKGAKPADYERATGASPDAMRSALAMELPDGLAAGLDHATGALRRATVTALPRAARMLPAERIAPLSASALGLQFRRAGLPAMGQVAMGLGVRAKHVLFGHLHRAGPLPEDDVAEWRTADGRIELHNTGSWVYEPLLLTGVRPPHPYWPGGAVLVEDGRPPRTLKLLDDVAPAALT